MKKLITSWTFLEVFANLRGLYIIVIVYFELKFTNLRSHSSIRKTAMFCGRPLIIRKHQLSERKFASSSISTKIAEGREYVYLFLLWSILCRNQLINKPNNNRVVSVSFCWQFSLNGRIVRSYPLYFYFKSQYDNEIFIMKAKWFHSFNNQFIKPIRSLRTSYQLNSALFFAETYFEWKKNPLLSLYQFCLNGGIKNRSSFFDNFHILLGIPKICAINWWQSLDIWNVGISDQ